MRLFFAIELSPRIQRVLGRLKTEDSRDYRWVDSPLLHLTLAFLGEQPEDRLPVLERVGKEAARASRGGVLRLGKAGHFGSTRAPRVLWVDLDGDLEAVLGLQRHLDAGLRTNGFDTEDRPFRPHITLARRREHATGGPPHGWPPVVEPVSFELDRLTLMHSRLGPRGPTYTPVLHVPVGG